jgi:hypothetical protein
MGGSGVAGTALSALALLTALLVGCAAAPTVPQSTAKRYLAFIEHAELPLRQRLAQYLGFSPDATEPAGHWTLFESKSKGAISRVAVRLESNSSGSQSGKIATVFDPSFECITLNQLSQVGSYFPGAPFPIHTSRPDGSFGLLGMGQDDPRFEFRLSDGSSLEAEIVMAGNCLAQLTHAITGAGSPTQETVRRRDS